MKNIDDVSQKDEASRKQSKPGTSGFPGNSSLKTTEETFGNNKLNLTKSRKLMTTKSFDPAGITQTKKPNGKKRNNLLSSSTNEDTNYFYSTPTSSFKNPYNNTEMLPTLSPRIYDVYGGLGQMYPDRTSVKSQVMKSLPDIFNSQLFSQTSYATPSRTLLVDRLKMSFDDLNVN